METKTQIRTIYTHVTNQIYTSITPNGDGTFSGFYSDFGKRVEATFKMESEWADMPDSWDLLYDYGFEVYESDSNKFIATNKNGVRLENFPRGFLLGGKWNPSRFQFEITNDNGRCKFENVPANEAELQAVFNMMGITK